ncbi:uncharacterized protein LOC124274542 [Haliotis rubra]|uniref:uncharacterized protein LOC124274542 n=1 Tax=Haliotis rubra TaxID=36100 RepID=UPI001EE600D9|nr:uncharacterized protein LOC124274542 [Haliotis rubra]
MLPKVHPSTDGIPTEREDEQPVVSDAFFKHLRVTSCLGGIYRRANPGEKMIWWDRIKLVYVVFVEILFVTCIVFFLIATYNYAVGSRPIIRLLSFCAIMAINLYLSLIYSIFLSKTFHLLHVRFRKYEELYGFSDEFKKWVKRLRPILVCSHLFTASSGPLEYFMTKSYPKVMYDIFPTMVFTEPWKSAGVGITCIGYTLVEFQWITNYTVIPFLSLFVWQEFKRVETQFKELSNSQCDNTESRFNTLVIHFDHITEILEDISNYVQHSIFTYVFMTLPVTCAVLYSILSKHVSSEEVMVYSVWCVWALLCVGCRLLIDALVSSKAHGTLQYVWGLDKQRFSGKGLQKVNLFVSRLTGDTIGYNIHGLFTITMPTLLGIAGTLVTYIIVVVQFKPSDSSCQCNWFRNVTGSDM